MSKHKIIIILALAFLTAWLPRPGLAQMALGQYEEEAPVRTWNIFGPQGAAGLGLGETSFIQAADASVLFTNPALLTRLPRLAVSISGSLQSASFFRYGPVNTGPVYTDGNAGLNMAAADFAALTVKVWGWRVGLGLALSEIYDRPPVEARSTQYAYLFSFKQAGYLRILNFSLGREVAAGFSLGLGFNLVSGRWEWNLTDAWSGVSISDARTRSFKGYFFNGGLHWQASAEISLAAAFRAPYQRRASSRSNLRYSAQAADILIQADGEDIFRQPLVLGLGLDWRICDNFRLAGQVAYWNWSSYKASLFGEELTRDFRDVWKAGLGLEYMGWFRLFGQDFDLPTRIGLVYDPQPMKLPRSSYLNFSLGFGFRWKGIQLDMGTIIGAEKGSGWHLTTNQIALTLTLSSGPKPAKG
ncbi:MAG TPA: hypothetical protein VGB72_06405 [Acidobacteriota bacterium]